MPIASHTAPIIKTAISSTIIEIQAESISEHLHKKSFDWHAAHFCGRSAISEEYQGLRNVTPMQIMTNLCESSAQNRLAGYNKVGYSLNIVQNRSTRQSLTRKRMLSENSYDLSVGGYCTSNVWYVLRLARKKRACCQVVSM